MCKYKYFSVRDSLVYYFSDEDQYPARTNAIDDMDVICNRQFNNTLTRQQLMKTIQESDVATLNGYATHKQLDGYRDCYLAKPIHDTKICLKACHTLTMKENARPTYRWRYYEDTQEKST